MEIEWMVAISMTVTWKLDWSITFSHKRLLSPNFQSAAMRFRPFSTMLSVIQEISRSILRRACETSNFGGRDRNIPKFHKIDLPLGGELSQIFQKSLFFSLFWLGKSVAGAGIYRGTWTQLGKQSRVREIRYFILALDFGTNFEGLLNEMSWRI